MQKPHALPEDLKNVIVITHSLFASPTSNPVPSRKSHSKRKRGKKYVKGLCYYYICASVGTRMTVSQVPRTLNFSFETNCSQFFRYKDASELGFFPMVLNTSLFCKEKEGI